MSLSTMGSATAVAVTERSSASRADDTREAESFAGMFASAMNAPKHEAKAPTRAEGTSELDRDESDADDSDTANVSERAPALESRQPAATNDVVRSIHALDPELLAKLARVISRVEQETGHDVTVAETFRSQARQNALFAQGRTTDGPVVTWTQSSRHSQGRAVDVMLDNGSASPEAYQALQRIANEEGLRTLGAKDPGHLELRGNATPRVDATSLNPTEPADATGSGQGSVARLAEVARVADVQVERPATVASVARVASVAQAAQSSATHAVGSSKSGNASTDSGSRRDASSDSHRDGYTAFGGFSTRDLTSPASQPVTATAAPAGSDAVARAERVMNAMDSAPARPLSHITMSVDGANGTTDRVHVSLRGSSLETTIDTGDARVANLLRARSDELSQALRRDGVELRELRVRSATETATVTAATAGQASQSSGDASTQSRFGRGDAWQKQQDQQDRHRSQQERGRQQQRQGRGGER